MSWFKYSDQTRRRYRKGINLRIRHLPENLLSKIKANITRKEQIAWITVSELRPNDQVLLEIWCYQLKNPWLSKDKPEKFTVFHLLVDENPDWICEGDQGRGLI